MPSTSSPPHDPPGDASLQHNGAHAVQPSDGPAVANATTPISAADLMRQGKLKAKAVLEASGVNGDADPAGQNPQPRPGMESPQEQAASNGASPSRKRSRSGSRRPSHAPVRDSKEAAEARKQAQLARMVQRDLIGSAARIERESTLRKQLIKDLSQEEKYYEELRTLNHPAHIFGYGYMGYGNGITDTPNHQFAIQYPKQRRQPGNRRARRLQLRKEQIVSQSEQVEELVPVRLEIDLDKLKLRDTFTWNLHDRWTTTELFAEHLVEDFQLPPELREHVKHQVNREIQEQLVDFYPHAYFDDEADVYEPYSAFKNDEMRIVIKLNITIGLHTLVDQFEWEINDQLNSPEEFAQQMAADLSLSGEFTTAIAHSIREQCQMFTKSLYITGHPFDGRPVEDADIRDNFLPSPLPYTFRPMQTAKDFSPYLYELSEAELERAEVSIMREQRRQKRSVNRRGGPALPDLKDRQRTVRTLLVSSVLPGTAETLEESHLFKTVRKAREGRRRGLDDESSDSDSEDSVADSPAPSQLTGGTARTRNMRGAATAAQVAMRSAIGRSATPELAVLSNSLHESRTARQLRAEAREESVATDPDSLVVKLRISSAKLREWAKNPKAFLKAAGTPVMSNATAPARSTPGVKTMPPPPSPAAPSRSTPQPAPPSADASSRPAAPATPTAQGQQDWHYYPDGRADAPWPMPPGAQQAPPPPWLLTALADLQKADPDSLFEPTMRYSVIDEATSAPVKLNTPAPATLPPGRKAMYLPRIRCIDCPGRVYNAGPEHTAANFQKHLNNRHHRVNVETRTGKGGS